MELTKIDISKLIEHKENATLLPQSQDDMEKLKESINKGFNGDSDPFHVIKDGENYAWVAKIWLLSMELGKPIFQKENLERFRQVPKELKIKEVPKQK